jgi:hypothetical protein
LTGKLIAGIAVLLACACTSPGTAVVVKLDVSELDANSVDGRLVWRMALANVLLAKRQESKQWIIHIVPSSNSNDQAVAAAVKAAQETGAGTGIIGNERFRHFAKRRHCPTMAAA